MDIKSIKNVSGGILLIEGISFADQETKIVLYDTTIFSNNAGDVCENFTKADIELYDDTDTIISDNQTAFDLINKTANFVADTGATDDRIGLPSTNAQGNIGAYTISTDVNFTDDSDEILATQKATKAYVDASGGGGGGGGAETLLIGMATGTTGSFDGSYAWCGAVVPTADSTIATMGIWVVQTGSGTLSLGIYNSSFTLLASTNTFSTGSTGVITANLTTSQTLNAGELYYFGIGGNANGLQVLGMSTVYQSNQPFLAKEDQNSSTLPSPFTGGSSTAKRIWIGAYT